MDHNRTETSIMSSNTTKSVFYCPHIPQLIWDVHDTISPWIFATFASIISPRCSSFERVSYHSNYEKERTTETFQYPVVKYGRHGPSCRCYMFTVICYRWILTSLSNSSCSAYLHARRGNSLFLTHSDILFAVPSGADCMGEIRGHSKMEGLQRFTD